MESVGMGWGCSGDEVECPLKNQKAWTVPGCEVPYKLEPAVIEPLLPPIMKVDGRYTYDAGKETKSDRCSPAHMVKPIQSSKSVALEEYEKSQTEDERDNYAALKDALAGALDQSENGKGKERHADGERFEHQKICVIGRWLKTSPVAGPLQQAVKKLVESSRFTPERAIHEIQGAINYAAAAIILLQEMVDE